MNVSIEQAKNRANKIEIVENTLRKIIEEGDRMIDEEKFWIEISEQLGCSERTAKEYIAIAKHRINAK